MLSKLIKVAAHIRNDPDGVGYAGMTDAEVHSSLTAPIQTPRRVPMSELHDWATARRIVKRFHDADMVGTALWDELNAMLTGKQEDANMQSDAGVGLVSDMVSAGIVSQSEAAELAALGYETTTMAARLGCPDLTEEMVGTCRGGV